jgi:preprotein translocase subunit YajC
MEFLEIRDVFLKRIIANRDGLTSDLRIVKYNGTNFQRRGLPFSQGFKHMEMFAQLLPFVFLIAIMYFVIIRPQQQQAKKHKEMVESLKKGDKIVTNGGLIATVKKVEETFFSVEIADKVVVKITKDAVARKYGDEA